ncbi:MAG: hypothetical protein AB9891_00375 [Anaerolineaceae bacterium]
MPKAGSTILSRKLYMLTIGGGVVFWATTFVTSLLPIAAEYRTAFSERSWKIQTVWVDSLLVGLIIGFWVSYSLLRFIKKNPTKNPIQKSMILSFTALIIAIILIEVPQSFLRPGVSDALHTLIIGSIFNVVRFLFLGFAIGYLYTRFYGSAHAQIAGVGSPDYSLFNGDNK